MSKLWYLTNDATFASKSQKTLGTFRYSTLISSKRGNSPRCSGVKGSIDHASRSDQHLKCIVGVPGVSIRWLRRKRGEKRGGVVSRKQERSVSRVCGETIRCGAHLRTISHKNASKQRTRSKYEHNSARYTRADLSLSLGLDLTSLMGPHTSL